MEKNSSERLKGGFNMSSYSAKDYDKMFIHFKKYGKLDELGKMRESMVRHCVEIFLQDEKETPLMIMLKAADKYPISR